MVTAAAALDAYARLDAAGRRAFFAHLNDTLDLDPDAVIDAARDYRDDRTPARLARLEAVAEPRRQELLRRLNAAPGATAAIVRMRADLLDAMREDPALGRTDRDFRHLLRSWFNRGFLVLRQITWATGADVLEKIIAYEAVHEITNWDDLRGRLHPPDRRCFAFFHPAMPGEPLIFVEVALTRGMPSSIQATLDAGREIIESDQADTAVFYSISNCQAGLAGISFGNSLIKQVVRDLAAELPQLKTFVTLSPIPGFAAWCAEEGGAEDGGDDLLRLAARFLLTARRDDGLPADPVARFHLGNGAKVLALHAGADTSPRGMAQSRGVMVNYAYEPARIAANARAYAENGRIAASGAVRALARQARVARSAG